MTNDIIAFTKRKLNTST